MAQGRVPYDMAFVTKSLTSAEFQYFLMLEKCEKNALY